MEKQNKVQATQGVDLDKLPTPELKDVLSWLNDDLGRARALLQAIHDNPDIKLRVAEHMLGQIQNYKQSKKAAVNEPVN